MICAYALDGTGKGQPLAGAAVSDMIRDPSPAWVHLNAAHPSTREWLEREVPYLDQIILEALLAEETRPRIAEHDDGILMILRGVNLSENAEPEDMVSVRMWIDEHRIITTIRRRVRAVEDIRERLEAGNGPTNAADFLVELATRLIERMEPVLTELDERTDTLEERILNDPDTSERQEINDIRKMAIVIRRHLAPQKDAMMALRNCEVKWLEKNHKRKLQEGLDRLTRYIEDLDAIRDRGQIIKDELASVLADRMNKNLYVLSLIAALFLPLGFLTGLLGINVGGMPGSADDGAFWIVCGICAICLILEYLIFRLLRWI